MNTGTIKSRCGRVAAFVLAGALALGLAPSAQAADYNLNGATVSWTATDIKTNIKGKTAVNGTINVSSGVTLADGTYTFGSDLILNHTSGQWSMMGSKTIKLIDGATFNFSSSSDIYFGNSYNGTTQLILDNGTFNSTAADIYCPWMNTADKNPVVNVVLNNRSALTLPYTKEIKLGQFGSTGATTINTTLAVTNSTITAKQIRLGVSLQGKLKTPKSSSDKAYFGPGAVLNVGQVYSYAYPAPTVVFDGAKICWNPSAGDSIIGQNNGVTTRMYTIGLNGLEIYKDASTDSTRTTVSGMASALSGTGGITKTGTGTINWNTGRIGESTTEPMTFTGPLVVSNGTWTSTLGYAASAFRAEGGNLTLSGALSASSVALSATDGGVLTLAGATITDASPDLTLATGGTTDYFTRDGAVAIYTFDTFTLGAGGNLSLDANATEIDAISATTTNVTATAANPAVISINFLVAPTTGQTFTLFETDDAAKFNVNPKLGNFIFPHETSVVKGALTLTITADDYTWNGSWTNWGDAGAWDKNSLAADWEDGNNAIFATDGATVTLAANASASAVRFTADATVSGQATLTAPKVDVASGVNGAISAPTAGSLEKTGTGTLTLGTSRTEQTTVTEGTLAMAAGATVDPAKLTLGTDSAKPVMFDYGGQTLTANPATYVGGGMNVTLTNGVFTYGSTIGFGDSYPDAPAVLTVTTNATLQSDDHFTITPPGEMTLNIVGGTMKSTKNTDNWMLQRSLNGRMNINVTDGGLLEFGGETYMLTCRDAVGGSTEYQSPKLNMKVVDSTVRVKNNKSIRFGLDDSMKPSATPEFTLGATNSVFDIAYGLYIGNNPAEGRATGGFYKTDFENCVITARQFRVHGDKPLSNARLNNSRIVFNTAGDITAPDGDAKWITVDVGGLTIDNQTFTGDLKANLGGSGTVTKVGTGKLSINTNQTATAALVCEEGETFLNAGLTVGRAVTVASNATFTVKATAQSTIASLTFKSGATLNINAPTVGVTPIAVMTSVTLPADGTVALKKDGGVFAKGLYPIMEKAGVTAADAVNLVPETSNLPYEWTVQGDTLILAVDMGLTGFVWTGLAGDGKMSTGGNWLNGVAPSVAGTDLDFSSVATATTVIGDIDATFGTVTMGEGIVTFNGSLAAASFSNTRKIVVDADSAVVVAGDLTINFADGDGIVSKVDAGGRFVVDGILTVTGGGIHPVLNAGGGCIVAGGIELNSTLYSTKDTTSQKWAVGPSGLTGQNYIWCLSNKANDCWIHPYTNDFTIAVSTVVRDAIDHHELNTTGYGDNQPHTITLDAGFADAGQLYIAGTGKVVVNSVPTATGGKAAYSGSVTVTDTATLSINAGKKLTTGTITFNSGTTLEVPSTGAANTGALAFSGEGTVTLKISGSELVDGEYTVLTSSSVLANDIVNKFTLDASAVKGSKDAWLTPSGDGKSLVLNIGSRASQPANTWVGGSGTAFSTAANWANGVVPTSGTLDFSRVTVNATINCGDLSGTVFDTANLGTAARKITIDGTLHLGTMTVTATDANFSVAANSKLIIDGDVTLEAATSGAILYVVYYNQGEVEIGGKVVVNGKTKGYTCYNCSETATIAAKGILLNVTSGGDRFKLNAKMNTAPMTNWIIGEDGLDATGSLGYWIDRGDGNNDSGCGATLHAATNFTISARIYARQFLNLDTGNGYTITVSGNGLIDGTYVSTAYNHMEITGSGRVVCDYVTGSYPGDSGGAYNGDITVTNTATLAINAGKLATKSAITVESGATLEVAQSGTVTLEGALTCAAGTTLKFNFTDGRTAPKLVLSQTPTFGAVKVDVAGAWPKSKKNTIIEWPEGTVWPEGFNIGSVFTLADNQPKWVTGIAVEGDSLVLTTSLAGTMIIVR